jgi:hypothetical protein
MSLPDSGTGTITGGRTGRKFRNDNLFKNITITYADSVVYMGNVQQ